MKRFMTLLVTVTLSGLVYVNSEIQTVKIGYEIRKQEESKAQLLDRARALKYNVARLKAPHNLERKLIAQKIVLDSPKQWQTLVLPGPNGQQVPMAPINKQEPPFFTRFFVGTAQAEAKDN